MEEMNNKTKILGLVTLYNPEFPNAVKNIMRYLPYLDLLIIWDNSPLEANIKQKVLESLAGKTDKIIWHGDGTNYCIAPAINFTWHYARESGYDLILLMDQDSQWEDFNSYKTDAIEHFHASGKNVYCPYIPSDDTFEITKEEQEKKTFINSGTIIPTSILNEIGGADEAFPLDALDHDLAIRVQKAEYKIVSLTKHSLHHTVGNLQRMGIFHVYTPNYSPQRLYSISRSHIMKFRKHKDWLSFSEIKKTFKEHYLKQFLRILLAEPHKICRLKMFFKGIYDGVTYPLLILLLYLLPSMTYAADNIKDELPIIAYYGVTEQNTTKEAFRTFRNCGFTVSLFPYSSLENLLKACSMAEYLGIRIIGSCPELWRLPAKTAMALKDNKGFLGYLIRDEPTHPEIKELQAFISTVKKTDDSHLFYMNLLPYSDPEKSLKGIKANSYPEYLQAFTASSCQQISFDFYPVTTKGIRPTWYHNLEMIRQESLRSGKPFWGFALSMPHDVPFTPHTYYPAPTLAALRLQVYSNLAYGAQAIQYFTYWTPDDSQGFHFHDAPISSDGKRTKTYGVVQKMNRELKEIARLFYGAKILSVHHLGSTIPEGTTRLTKTPENLSSLKMISRKGAIVSQLEKNGHRYLAIVNKDHVHGLKILIKPLNNVPCHLTKVLKEEPIKDSYQISAGDILLFRLK